MFKNLKSLFITVDETTEETKPVTETAEKTAMKNQANSVSNAQPENKPSTSSAGPAPTKDDAIVDKLMKALEDNNQPGFDYFEYKRSLKSLEKLPMDEATKYQSAFATAATMEVTLDKLVASIEFYKKVLKQEEVNFLKVSKEQYTLNVENKKADIEKISKLIKDKSLKIQQLTEEIRGHQQSQEELLGFINTADTKIKTTENSFHFALEDINSQMDNDLNKLKQYIK